jgi:hypothetical protein
MIAIVAAGIQIVFRNTLPVSDTLFPHGCVCNSVPLSCDAGATAGAIEAASGSKNATKAEPTQAAKNATAPALTQGAKNATQAAPTKGAKNATAAAPVQGAKNVTAATPVAKAVQAGRL